MTDPSRNHQQRRHGGIAGHVPAKQPVIFAGIRTTLCARRRRPQLPHICSRDALRTDAGQEHAQAWIAAVRNVEAKVILELTARGKHLSLGEKNSILEGAADQGIGISRSRNTPPYKQPVRLGRSDLGPGLPEKTTRTLPEQRQLGAHLLCVTLVAARIQRGFDDSLGQAGSAEHAENLLLKDLIDGRSRQRNESHPERRTLE